MPYILNWDQTAEDELARIWNAAPDKQAVADAADLLDQRLRLAPDHYGQDFGTFRMYTITPLTVVFQVCLVNRAVRVLDVWRSA
jgi:hypothetical protein